LTIAPASLQIPDDPYYANEQWGIRKIQAEYGWAQTTGSTSMLVCVIDSGEWGIGRCIYLCWEGFIGFGVLCDSLDEGFPCMDGCGALQNTPSLLPFFQALM
jgi:hypothetical protein